MMCSRCRPLGGASPLIFAQRYRSLGMQQHAALEQRKASLPIRTAFDPLHFIDKPLNHAVTPGLGAPIRYSFCIIGKPIDKVDQFRDATGLDGCFPVFQSLWTFSLPQKLTKCLGQGECGRDHRITLAELSEECSLVWCSVFGRTNDHERDTSCRWHFLQRDGSRTDQFCPMRAKLGNDPFNRP